MVILALLKMVMFCLTALWKKVLQISLAILALDSMGMHIEFVSLIQFGQEQYQHAYVSC